MFNQGRQMKFSVVIPCKNEAENLAFLLDEVDAAFDGRDYEVIVVDDGSDDGTGALLAERMKQDGSRLRVMRHDRSAGKSAAERSGALAAKGDFVCLMDGDGQNNPADLPRLIDALLAAGPGCGIAAGQRLKRTDTRLKQLSSRFANGLRQAILKDRTRDSGCGLKVIRTDLMRSFPLFDGMHRYYPALAIREGYDVTHVDVIDRGRRFGVSKYGIVDRGLQGALDLFGVWWLRKRRKVVPMVTEVRP